VSEVSDAAVVRMFLADYAVVDPAGKINAIGGGLTAVGFNPGTGMSASFALFVQVGVPPALYGSQSAIEILLQDAGGELVELPGPAPGLPQQPVRVGQAVRFDEPQFPQPVSVPARFLQARVQWVLGFTSGLPLMPSQAYSWRVKIDDESNDEWIERFVVLGPAPGPVIG